MELICRMPTISLQKMPPPVVYREAVSNGKALSTTTGFSWSLTTSLLPGIEISCVMQDIVSETHSAVEWYMDVVSTSGYGYMVVEVVKGLRIPLDEYPLMYLDELPLMYLDDYRFLDLFGGDTDE